MLNLINEHTLSSFPIYTLSLLSTSSAEPQYDGADSEIATVSKGTSLSEIPVAVNQTSDGCVDVHGARTKAYEGYEYLCILL